MRWSAGNRECLTKGSAGRIALFGITLFLQRNSFLGTAGIFSGSSENGRKMLGKDMDCSPGLDNPFRITPCILGVSGFKGE